MVCRTICVCGLGLFHRSGPFNATPALVFNENQTPKPTTLGLVFREKSKKGEQMDLFVTEKCLLRLLCAAGGTERNDK